MSDEKLPPVDDDPEPFDTKPGQDTLAESTVQRRVEDNAEEHGTADQMADDPDSDAPKQA